MPDRCVVFGCSNLANVAKGISLHRIPFLKRRKKRSKAQEKAMDRLCQGYTRQVGPNQEYGCILQLFLQLNCMQPYYKAFAQRMNNKHTSTRAPIT